MSTICGQAQQAGTGKLVNHEVEIEHGEGRALFDGSALAARGRVSSAAGPLPRRRTTAMARVKALPCAARAAPQIRGRHWTGAAAKPAMAQEPNQRPRHFPRTRPEPGWLWRWTC